jgi:hypothetical protein
VGYYTLAATSVALDDLPAKTTKRLPMKGCHHDVIKLEAGHALRAGKALKRKLAADVIKQGMTRGPFFRQPQAPARFKLGDRVRTKNIHPLTHTRLPRYARGRFGVVELVHGCHAFPDAVAIDKGDDPPVVFDGRELWARTPTPRSRSRSTRLSPISIPRNMSFVDDTVRHAAEAVPSSGLVLVGSVPRFVIRSWERLTYFRV